MTESMGQRVDRVMGRTMPYYDDNPALHIMNEWQTIFIQAGLTLPSPTLVRQLYERDIDPYDAATAIVIWQAHHVGYPQKIECPPCPQSVTPATVLEPGLTAASAEIGLDIHINPFWGTVGLFVLGVTVLYLMGPVGLVACLFIAACIIAFFWWLMRGDD